MRAERPRHVQTTRIACVVSCNNTRVSTNDDVEASAVGKQSVDENLPNEVEGVVHAVDHS